MLPTDTQPVSSVKLDFRSGGWVLLVALLLVAGITLWQVMWFVIPAGGSAIGDGRNVYTYGFELEPCLVPAEVIVAAGFPKDGLRSLSDPATITVAEMEQQRLGRASFLVSSDRVVGVEIAGEARCYPLRILIWHEVVNDTLGGRAIAVTYNPLCDSALLFDRTVGGRALTFGVSGLLYNSNLLMYDRQSDPNDESLWSQMQARAIAGPAARRGETLALLPFALTTWSAWRESHPHTRVLKPDPDLKKAYRREAYSTYAVSPKLQFPVNPLPSVPQTEFKRPCIGLRSEPGEWHVFEIGALLNRRAGGEFSVMIDGRSVALQSDRAHGAVWLGPAQSSADDADIQVAYAYLFAWHALLGASVHTSD